MPILAAEWAFKFLCFTLNVVYLTQRAGQQLKPYIGLEVIKGGGIEQSPLPYKM